jgi:WD40 repeat protein
VADGGHQDIGSGAAQGASGAAAARGEKLRVFVSYSREDLDFADQLVAGLELCGFEPVIDRHGISGGEEWELRLGNLIREADTIVFVLSPDSAASQICEWEVKQAASLNKRIIPVNCRPLDGTVPPEELRELNYIFFYKEPKTPGTGFGSGLARLVAALNTDLDWLREHTRLLQRAMEWEGGGRSVNRLLSGTLITEAKAWAARRPKDAPEPTGLHLDFIRASEEEEARRASDERRQIEAMAAAQAERAEALRAAEEANRRRARFRVVAFGLLAAVAVVAAGLAWLAETRRKEASRATQLAIVATIKAEGEKKRAEEQKALAEGQTKRAEDEKLRAEAALRQVASEKGRADQELEKAQVAESRLLASRAAEALAGGEYTKAALLALEGLPEPGAEKRRPVVEGLRGLLYDAAGATRERSLLLIGDFVGSSRVRAAQRNLAFSADGSRLTITHKASGQKATSYFRQAEVLDVASSTATLSIRGKGKFSPDGSRVIVDGIPPKLLDGANGSQIAELEGHKGRVTGASFSPDGALIVTTSEDKTARIWKAADGKVAAILTGHSGPLVHAQFSPNGDKVVTASDDNSLRIWDIASKTATAVLNGHTGALFDMAFSPDSARVVTASADGTVRIWDSSGGHQTAVIKTEASSARFTRDGKRVVTAEGIWDATSGMSVATLGSYSLFSPNDRFVLTALDQHEREGDARGLQTGRRNEDSSSDNDDAGIGHLRISVLDATTGTPIASVGGDTFGQAAFSPDSRRLLLASSEGTWTIWDIEPWKELFVLGGQQPPIVLSRWLKRVLFPPWAGTAAFSPDGQRVVVPSTDKAARIWDVASGKQLAAFKGHNDEVISASFFADGEWVLTVSADKTARTWRAAAGATLLQGHTNKLLQVSISMDGQRAVSVSSDKSVRIWDAISGREIASFRDPLDTPTRAAVSPDGQRLAIASSRAVRILELPSGKQKGGIATLRARCVAFSPDGQSVAIGGFDGEARIWNVATENQVAAFRNHAQAIHSITFSPDGRQVVTASSDNTARVWAADTGKEIATFARHGGRVTSAAFSPDGKLVVSGSADRSARVWEASSGAELASFRRHGGAVTTVDFSPDGKRILSGSEDGKARLWDIASGEEVSELRSWRDSVIWVSATASATGGPVAVTVKENTAQIWPSPWTSVIDDRGAIARLPRCFSKGERSSLSLVESAPSWCDTKPTPPWRDTGDNR